MSSISLIPCKVFNIVGGFDESLFIDGVDNEWCWRAWHKCGLRSFIVEDAEIGHMLGEGDRFFFLKKRHRSPFLSIPFGSRISSSQFKIISHSQGYHF